MTPYEREADEEWAAERLRRRLENLRAQRPKRLTDQGQMHPEVAAWSKRLKSGTAGNLLIVGPVGTTKTWNVWEALETAVAAGYAGQIVFAPLSVWHEAVAPPSPDRETIRRMRRADVLVLDDIGSAEFDEWERERALVRLLAVIDERWAHNRPIVITSNAASLRETLGERIASRLADSATVVVLDGEDRRRSR